MQLLEMLSAQAGFVNSEVIPWVLRLVMMGLGLSLTMADFKRVIIFPKAATIGLVAQLAGLPLVAFILGMAFNAPPAMSALYLESGFAKVTPFRICHFSCSVVRFWSSFRFHHGGNATNPRL